MKKRQSLIAVGYISAGNPIHQYLSFQFTLLLRKTINTQTMAFNGKWESESQEGYEEFCKLIGKLLLFKNLFFALLLVVTPVEVLQLEKFMIASISDRTSIQLRLH